MSTNQNSLKKILIINIFGIGDVLFTTPMIRNIKESIPDAFIGYMCNQRAFPVLENNPLINKFYIYEKDDWRKVYRQSKVRCFQDAVRFMGGVRQEGYDAVFDLSLDKYMSACTGLIGIKERIGFYYKRRGVFLTTRIPINGFEKKHVVEHYLDLLETQGLTTAHKRLEVYVRDRDRAWVEHRLAAEGIARGESVVGLIPGGGASWGRDARYRRWAPERHAQLADKTVEKFSVKVILMGDADEKDLGQRLTAAMRHRPLNLIGATTLGQYLALLERCRLVIVNDGGPLHMAVAAGAPTVSLIATVDESVYGPYPREGHRVVTKDIACRPCYRQFRRADCDHISCLNDIRVEEVFAEVEAALSEGAP